MIMDATKVIEDRIKKENRPKFKYLVKLFIHTFQSAKAMCFIFISLSILLSLFNPVLAYVWKRFTDDANQYVEGNSIFAMVTLLFAYFILSFLMNLLNRYTNAWEDIERLDKVQSNRFQELFDSKMYKKLAALPSEYFEIPSINDRIERVLQFTGDAWSGLNRNIMVQGYMIIAKIVSIISIGVSLYILAPELCILLLIAPIPTIYTTYINNKLQFKFAKDNTKLQREANYYEKLMLGPSAKEMKALSLYDFFYGKWKEKTDIYIKKERKKQIISAILSMISNLIYGLAIAANSVLAILFMIQGKLSLGGLGASLVLSKSLVADIFSLFSAIGTFVSKKNEASMFFDLVDLPEQITKEEGGMTQEEIHTMEVKDLSYRYPLTEHFVLDHINVTIRQGEKIALVGENGAGKSTFVRLIAGMSTPTSGELLVNGIPEREETRGRRYDKMSTVLQSPARYTTFTVEENVRLGDVKLEEANTSKIIQDEKIEENNILNALHAAGFQVGESGESDAKLDTMLGKDIGGTDLSGGQWQKLAIARAHYRNRNFIILDEPTGNLDPKAEAEVFQKYITLAEGKTLLMVTHRISVAALADRIIVFANGKIAEDGTHDELIAMNGEYARLYREQAKWYDR